MGRSYTSKGKPVPFRFDLDGVEFVAAHGVTLLDMCEVLQISDLDVGSAEAGAAIATIFRAALGDADYDRLKRHCREHDTDPGTLFEILGDLAEHVTGRPTARSGPSSPGPQNTTGTSRDAWPPPVRELTDDEITAWRNLESVPEPAPAIRTPD
jgi:hypothetical protein